MYFFDSLVYDLLKADPTMKLEELGDHIEIIAHHNKIEQTPTYNDMLQMAKRFYDKGDQTTSDKIMTVLEEDLKEKERSQRN